MVSEGSYVQGRKRYPSPTFSRRRVSVGVERVKGFALAIPHGPKDGARALINIDCTAQVPQASQHLRHLDDFFDSNSPKGTELR